MDLERYFCGYCVKGVIDDDPCPCCGRFGVENNLPHQLKVGSWLHNQYRIGRVLGQGGFGITYLARDMNLDMLVAIKEFYPSGMVGRTGGSEVTVTAEMEQYEASLRRFSKEARLLAKIQDVPEIVHVYNFFEENGTAYLVMEYLQGRDLREYLNIIGGHLTPEETIAILKPVMSALEKVHKLGLVHRDVSPDNIMLTNTGKIKLLDFGIAKDMTSGGTMSTSIALKHGYAPMEQYQTGGNIGPWTDEYALCATAYFCMTAKIPPEAPTRVMDNVDIGWEQIPGMRPQWAAAFKKGYSFIIADRYQTMGELAAALDAPAPRPVLQQAPAPQPTRAAVPPAPQPMPRPKPTPQVTPAPKRKKVFDKELVLLLLFGAVVLFFTFRSYFRAPAPKGNQPGITVTTAAPTEAYENNLLMGFKDEEFDHENRDGTMLGSQLRRSEIQTVTFLDTTRDKTDNAWDVSENGDGSVLAWTVQDPNTRLYDLYIGAEGGINADAITLMCRFQYCSNLTKVRFDGNLHTEDVRYFTLMFNGCYLLREIDFTGIDTGNAVDMYQMFGDCKSLKTLDLRTFRTDNVEDISYMFADCSGLEALYLNGWHISDQVKAEGIFSGCTEGATVYYDLDEVFLEKLIAGE